MKPEIVLLRAIRRCCTDAFGEQLTGIYLHGSLALSGFCWETSDVDFLVVVRCAPSGEQKERMIRHLLEMEPLAPRKGLEMSVVREEHVRNFVYPTPFELHFSPLHAAKAAADLSGFCRTMHGTDCDLAAHFAVTRQSGICLYGPAAETLFSPAPQSAYLDSIARDLEDAQTDILREPVYVILNLCRSLAYVRCGKILSKQQGGVWALENTDSCFRPLIAQALDAYAGKADFPVTEQAVLLTAFADRMHRDLFAFWKP